MSKATRGLHQPSGSTPAALPELPEAVVTCILQHLSIEQRLTSCSLVCKAWHTAASHTTAHICFQLSDEDDEVKVKQLQSWVEMSGGRVTSICLVGRRFPWLQADFQSPCSKLTNLETLSVLGGVKLKLDTSQARISTRSRSRAHSRSASAAAAASTGNVLPAAAAELLPQLRTVKLRDCYIPLRHILQLVKQVGLTSLHLDSTVFCVSAVSDRHASTQQTQRVVTETLKQLQNLSKLTLVGLQLPYRHYHFLHPAADGAQETQPLVQHISSMQCLQELHIDAKVCADVGTLLQHVPTSLTALSLFETDMVPTAVQLQQATRLSTLQRFELSTADINPRLLSVLRKLQSLHLADIALTNSAARDAGSDNDDDVQAAEAFLQELLSGIGQMTQLQHLQLSNVDSALTEPALQQLQFSPLTASSHLTSLQLSVIKGMPLPKFALSQIMPHGKVLPHLRVLQLEGHRYNVSHLALVPNSDDLPFDSADIRCMVACCPGLTDLTLVGCLSDTAASLQPLVGLAPTLTALRISLFGDAVAAVVLTKLAGLSSLSCVESSLGIYGIQQLTVLRALTRLEVESCYLPYDEIGKWPNYELNRCGALGWVIESDLTAQQPDVWRKVFKLMNPHKDSDYYSK